MAVKYNEAEITKAQEAWRAQDLETFSRTDPESMKKRHDALIDLLVAHIPIEEGSE